MNKHSYIVFLQAQIRAGVVGSSTDTSKTPQNTARVCLSTVLEMAWEKCWNMLKVTGAGDIFNNIPIYIVFI